MVRDVKTPKRPYRAPSFEVLDVKAVKEQLDAETKSTCEDARRMLAVIESTLKKRNPPRIQPHSTCVRKLDS